MTEGNTCQGSKGPIRDITDFLGLPNISVPVKLGNSECPWSNRFYSLLKAAYPKCVIDVENLAHGATTQHWAFEHMLEYFSEPNGARGGRRLADAVDLVVVEYGVNDGYSLDKGTLARLGVERTMDGILSAREATSEYVMKYLLTLPGKPAVLYMATGSTESHLDSLMAYYDAARRFKVPLVSFKHAASYPDDPRWRSFGNPQPGPDGVHGTNSKFGFFEDCSNVTRQPKEVLVRDIIFPGVCEGKHLYLGTPWANPFAERPHAYLNCYGSGAHPYKAAHATMAQVLYYFIQMEVTAAKITIPMCEKAGLFPSHALPSENAKRLSLLLNPLRSCPQGFLAHFNSKDCMIHPETAPPNVPGTFSDSSTKWRLIEDRLDKYGWVIEGLDSMSPALNTITFNLTFWGGSPPHIVIEYMHSYEKAGKVSIEIVQLPKDTIGPPESEQQTQVLLPGEATPHSSGELIGPGNTVVVDSFVPSIKNALVTEIDLSPIGYEAGEAMLRVTLLDLSAEELQRRGGLNKFKLTSVQAC